MYVLDANIFMEAHRRYYGFDICPGFWDCLIHHHQALQLVSIDKVRDEILTGDALGEWVKNSAPRTLFDATDDPAVTANFGEMMRWVQAQEQFKDEAKAEFAAVADGWLPAYAKANGGIVVTHEEYAAEAKARVPLPNVCRQFGVENIDTFAMLRKLEARFHWQAP